jgi:lauroyl/myristoyl acyltransferase
MQLDRVVGGAHARLPFFGAEASFPLGPALMARSMRAPLLLVFMVREGSKGFRVKVEEVLRVPHTRDRVADATLATARMVATYADYVRRYPYQWFQFHDVWAPPPEAASSSEDAASLSRSGSPAPAA